MRHTSRHMPNKDMEEGKEKEKKKQLGKRCLDLTWSITVEYLAGPLPPVPCKDRKKIVRTEFSIPIAHLAQRKTW